MKLNLKNCLIVLLVLANTGWIGISVYEKTLLQEYNNKIDTLENGINDLYEQSNENLETMNKLIKIVENKTN